MVSLACVTVLAISSAATASGHTEMLFSVPSHEYVLLSHPLCLVRCLGQFQGRWAETGRRWGAQYEACHPRGGDSLRSRCLSLSWHAGFLCSGLLPDSIGEDRHNTHVYVVSKQQCQQVKKTLQVWLDTLWHLHTHVLVMMIKGPILWATDSRQVYSGRLKG